MKEEKMKVLEMLVNGVIDQEQAYELLETIYSESLVSDDDFSNEMKKGKKPKWLKVIAYDPDDDTRVNIRVPIAILKLGLGIGAKFSVELNDVMKQIDYDEVMAAVDSGMWGEIVNVKSDSGEMVKITLE